MKQIIRLSVLVACTSAIIVIFLWRSNTSVASTGNTASLSATPVPTGNTDKVLNYIAQRENIPVNRLFVVNEHRRDYPLLNRSFWFVTALDQGGQGHFYTAMLDLADGGIVEVNEVETAEAKARQAQYGKLDPLLYERLENEDDLENLSGLQLE